MFQSSNQPEPDSLGRYYANGNPNLKPETSKNIELGIQKQQDWGLIGVKVYKNKVKDVIEYNPHGVFTINEPHYFNTGKLITKGIELSVNANVAATIFNFSHNYNDSKENNHAWQSLRRPKHITNLTINKRYGKFDSRVQVIKKSSTTDYSDNIFDGTTLVNLSSHYNLNNKSKVSLNIKNAFDKHYITGINMNALPTAPYNQLGRTIEIGLEYQF